MKSFLSVFSLLVLFSSQAHAQIPNTEILWDHTGASLTEINASSVSKQVFVDNTLQTGTVTCTALGVSGSTCKMILPAPLSNATHDIKVVVVIGGIQYEANKSVDLTVNKGPGNARIKVSFNF